MSLKMKSKLLRACALSTFMLAGAAHAQTAPPEWVPPQNLAHISIQATPSTELEVVPANGWSASAPVARCKEYCDFWALPGKYTLYTRDHTTGERKDLALSIKQSRRFELQTGDDAARWTGLALGVTGSAAFMAGLVLVTPVMLSSMCEDTNCTTKAQQDAATAGLVMILAGALTTPAGWIMYASNRTRLKRIDERSMSVTETIGQVRLGVAGVGLGGLGLAGVASF